MSKIKNILAQNSKYLSIFKRDAECEPRTNDDDDGGPTQRCALSTKSEAKQKCHHTTT